MIDSNLTDDPCEARARALHRLLEGLGVKCYVHWDRSPWGVRIPLVDPDPAKDDGFNEYLPALYVLTEGTREVAGKPDTWVWIGQLGNFGDDSGGGQVDSLLCDTLFKWIERHWFGDDVSHIADAVYTLLRILRLGASAAQETFVAAEQALP